MAPPLILQTELPEVVKGIVRQSLYVLVLHGQATVDIDLLPTVHNFGGVKVATLWHGCLRRRFYRHWHPRVVLRVEESDVVQRPVAERVTAEHPQTAASVGYQAVSEARQRFPQVIQMIGQIF